MCYSFTTKFNYVKHLKTSSDTLNIINLWFRPCAYRMIDKKAHTHTHTRKEQINPILYSSNLRLWTIINTCVIQKQWIPQQSSKREYFPFVLAIWDVCFFLFKCLFVVVVAFSSSFICHTSVAWNKELCCTENSLASQEPATNYDGNIVTVKLVYTSFGQTKNEWKKKLRTENTKQWNKTQGKRIKPKSVIRCERNIKLSAFKAHRANRVCMNNECLMFLNRLIHFPLIWAANSARCETFAN